MCKTNCKSYLLRLRLISTSVTFDFQEEPADMYAVSGGVGGESAMSVDSLELAEMTAELAGPSVKKEHGLEGLGGGPGGPGGSQPASLNHLIASQFKFLESAKDYKTADFLNAMAQLAHMNHT